MAIEHDTEFWGEYERLLGKCYLAGRGVEKNVEEAVRLFRESAEMEDPEGQLLFGLCHLGGVGVEKNESIARKWIRMAKRNGNSLAKAMKLDDGVLSISQYGARVDIPFPKLNEDTLLAISDLGF